MKQTAQGIVGQKEGVRLPRESNPGRIGKRAGPYRLDAEESLDAAC